MTRGLELPAVVGLVRTRELTSVAKTVSPVASATGLRRPSTGGSLVAICGLHGGAGTSTIAYALAVTAARDNAEDVLLVESDGACGDIAQLTGVVSPLGLSGLASEFAAGRPPRDGAFVRVDRLRVVASGSGLPGHGADGEVSALLGAARPLHGMIVVDAGTWRAPGSRELLRAATHVVWVLAVTPGAADRARGVLAVWSSVPARQALVARGDASGRKQTRALTELAGTTCDRLVLWENGPDPMDLGERRMQSGLTGLTTWLIG